MSKRGLPKGALLLGILIGLSVPPIFKALFGEKLWSTTCVSLCPASRTIAAAAGAGSDSPAAPFSSFIYPTWPESDQDPAVRHAAGSLWDAGGAVRLAVAVALPSAIDSNVPACACVRLCRRRCRALPSARRRR